MSTEGKQPDGTGYAERAGNQRQPPAGIAPPSTPNKEAPDKEQHRCAISRFFKKWHYEVEAVAVGAAVVYAWFTIKEWRTFDSERKMMEKELQEARKANELDERAWVGLEKNPVVETSGTNITFTASFKNTGKTPALLFRESIGFAGSEQVIPAPDESIPGTNDTYGAVFPDGEVQMSIGVLPWALVLSSAKRDFYFYAIDWYCDIYGVQHWSSRTFSVHPDFSVSFTTNKSGCDTNEEPDL